MKQLFSLSRVRGGAYARAGARAHGGRSVVLAAVLLALGSAAVDAQTLRVEVFGVLPGEGLVGCALFTEPDGFPRDVAAARRVWIPASAATVTCSFPDLPPGTYALSVMQDLNGNEVNDTNRLGMPQEPWGVSNNLRPRFRPPRFDEAAFELSDDRQLSVELGR